MYPAILQDYTKSVLKTIASSMNSCREIVDGNLLVNLG